MSERERASEWIGRAFLEAWDKSMANNAMTPTETALRERLTDEVLRTVADPFEESAVGPLSAATLNAMRDVLVAALAPLMAPRPNRFDCRECGAVGVTVDEDGCCVTCGSDAQIVIAEAPAVAPTTEADR